MTAKLARLLALGCLVAVMPATPALADHGTLPRDHLGPRLVYFEDRSGIASYQADIQNAVDLWNQSGADITLVYREGPASNRCSKEEYGVVRFCTSKMWKDISAWFIHDRLDGGHYGGGEIDIRPDRLGPYGPIHEGGHALGLDHSQLASVMNVSNSLRSSVPTEHDYESVRAIYAHMD